MANTGDHLTFQAPQQPHLFLEMIPWMIVGTAMKTISPPLLGPKKPDTLSSH